MSFALVHTVLLSVVQVLGPKKWLILGVNLTHLVESRYLFFLEAEIVDNIFQWDVVKNMLQLKCYDDMFRVIKALTVQKILKIRILSQNSCKMKAFFRFLSNALIQIVLQQKIDPYTSYGIICTSLGILFRRKLYVLY